MTADRVLLAVGVLVAVNAVAFVLWVGVVEYEERAARRRVARRERARDLERERLGL